MNNINARRVAAEFGAEALRTFIAAERGELDGYAEASRARVGEYWTGRRWATNGWVEYETFCVSGYGADAFSLMRTLGRALSPVEYRGILNARARVQAMQWEDCGEYCAAD